MPSEYAQLFLNMLSEACLVASNTSGMRKECTRNVSGMHKECTRNAQGIYKECTRSALGMQQECTRNTQGMHKECPQGMHKECARNASGMHQECTRNATLLLRCQWNLSSLRGCLNHSVRKHAWITVWITATVTHSPKLLYTLHRSDLIVFHMEILNSEVGNITWF